MKNYKSKRKLHKQRGVKYSRKKKKSELVELLVSGFFNMCGLLACNATNDPTGGMKKVFELGMFRFTDRLLNKLTNVPIQKIEAKEIEAPLSLPESVTKIINQYIPKIKDTKSYEDNALGGLVKPTINTMGNFRIVIDAVGDHGQDRSKKDGETVDFTNGRTDGNTPEAIIHRAVAELKALGTNVLSAKVYHWPSDTVYQGEPIAPLDGGGKECITDDLVTGVRKGQF